MGQGKQIRLCLIFAVLLLAVVGLTSCATTASSAEPFFGVNQPATGQVLRYVNGPEPASIDPHLPDGQPEARIIMALFEGLTEYDPKTLKPIPALAERWETNQQLTEYTFHLRKNGRWSDGIPITAEDFVYSLRRGVNPATGSNTATLANYVKYSEAFTNRMAFVREPATGRFLLKKDFKRGADLNEGAASPSPTPNSEEKITEAPTPKAKFDKEEKSDSQNAVEESDFHKFINSETRLTIPLDEKERLQITKSNPKLQSGIEGKELLPVKGEDIGIEAVDNYTVRITLEQAAPFFLSSLPHQLFRLVPRHIVDKYEDDWTKPENIVTNGPFKVKEWLPYNRLVVIKDPNYWDAANVKLSQIEFVPSEDQTTTMNLYKTGEVDAFFNHGVPSAWLGEISQFKDFMKLPEAANNFVKINTTHPPFDKVEVRKAFNMAIDKVAYASWRRTVLPSYAFVPEGIFAGYNSPKGDQFNPVEAKRLLSQAGYRDTLGNYDAAKFPVDDVEYLYNTGETNRGIAEFLQAQWKQNLGITVPLKSMEWNAVQNTTQKLEYKGLAQGAWSADYMDPYTFLDLFYSKTAGANSGWFDPAYKQMLDDANSQLDPPKRLDKLSQAEAYMLNAQPFISLATASTNFMKKPYLKGFYPNPQSLYAWKFVSIEHDQSKWDQAPPKMTE